MYKLTTNGHHGKLADLLLSKLNCMQQLASVKLTFDLLQGIVLYLEANFPFDNITRRIYGLLFLKKNDRNGQFPHNALV